MNLEEYIACIVMMANYSDTLFLPDEGAFLVDILKEALNESFPTRDYSYIRGVGEGKKGYYFTYDRLQ